jgi:ethanolamine ammonia-lyase large subunit
MLHYQSTSFHDALYARDLLKLRPAPEFEAWFERVGSRGFEKALLLC